jgi:hypothetical protein
LILTYLQSRSLEKAVAASEEFVQQTNGDPLASETLSLLRIYEVAGPYQTGWPDPKRMIAAVNNLWSRLGY